MNIKDLKPGDILLFSAEKGSFISWAITFLTDASVSHAAMFYDDKEKSIIEETPPQVAINNADKRFEGRKINVRRLKEDLPIDPVIEASTSYLNDEEPYDNSGLYIVGLLLLYKKFTPNNLVQKAMVKILKKITASIVKYIHEHQNPDKSPMVCSQFVAQCYAKAGDKYKLKIENGVLAKMAANQADSNNVIDQVIQIIENGKRVNLQALLTPNLKMQDNSSFSGEELCKELKDAFMLSTNAVSTDITDELVEAVSQFANAYYLYSPGSQKTHGILPKNTHEILRNISDNENMFTFPGDLLNHCNSLKDVGVIKL